LATTRTFQVLTDQDIKHLDQPTTRVKRAWQYQLTLQFNNITIEKGACVRI
jgi:hypothetical protein